ncbi:MAG: thioredoxin domain-containing protein [Parcubacteria group bacterium]|nr:thioredoxin domain-containing protein [Parcubacteria group bacterium]
MEKTLENKYLVPGSIIVAGFLIAIAVYTAGPKTDVVVDDNSFGNSNSAAAESVRKIDGADHIRGSVDARVSIIEFSDFECPFCARIHPTLSQIVEEYDGEVNWIYRDFPLTSIHSNAFGASVASECVAKLGGNDAYWEFTDQIFENQTSLGAPLFNRVAGELGLSGEAFAICLESDDIAKEVEEDIADALSSGGTGTPFVVVVNDRGETFPFSGALPYEQIKSIVEAALSS